MARLFSIKPTMTIKGRKFKGLRGWAGKPTHPPLTDIPVAAYILTMVFDLVSFIKGDGIARDMFRAATFVLIGGAIASVPTSLTGFWDWWKSTSPGTQAWRTANWHMAVMLTVTAIVVANIVVRLGGYEDTDATGVTVLVLSLLAGSLVAFGAAYGGALVFDYEFNVEQDKGYAWAESETDRLPGDS